MNIVLSGFMGSGKSTVGRRLSEILGMELRDTDKLIEEKAGITISEIFAKHGEEYFRNLETEICSLLGAMDGIIISAGGGALLRPQNAEALRRGGTVFYLDITPETVIKRLAGDETRPLIKNGGEAEIRRLMETRRPVYIRTADHIINADGPPETVAEEIAGIVKNKL